MKSTSCKFTGRNHRIAATLLLAAVLPGCSNQGMYESIRYSNRMECGKLPQPQYEECMQQNSMDYDEYRREREKVLNEKTKPTG